MDDITGISAKVAAEIEQAAQQAYKDLMRRVKAGEDARLAVKEVQELFTGQFAGATAAAFSAVLQREVTAGHILAMPVGDVALSQRLHQLSTQMVNTVSAVIRTHAQGMHNARDLALHLYDGYNPQDGILRPLEGATRAELPRALRALTDDRLTRVELTRLFDYGQKAASRLKSQAMKAAYMQAFDAWANDGGEKALGRALWVAQREKNRYAANRIAQTELARAHREKVGREFMTDPELSVVQVKMNVKHPLFDVCDLHSGADLFGLGKGMYPKAKAPRPPFHPHCWCRLVSRPDKHAIANLAERQGAVQRYLESLPPEQAARVQGSKSNFERVMRGASLDDVLNAGIDRAYHVKRLGQLDLSAVHPATGPQPMATQQNPVSIKNVASFQEQKTVKAAAKWAVDNNLADFADYTGIKPEVANAWNRSLFDHLQEFPELRQHQKFVGTGQAQFARWREIEIKRIIAQLQKANPQLPGHDFRPHAEQYVKAKKVDGKTYAHSWGQKDVSGIAVNKSWGDDVLKFEKHLQSDVKALHHPIGCDTIRSVVDHEIAHELDRLLDLHLDNEVVQAYNQAKGIGIKDEVSGYAGTSIKEFIAECWAESCNNPTPRQFAKKIASIVRDRYKSKYP